MRAQITLTSAESKRVIAKAVADMDVVRKALKNGTILIPRGTTNAFVLEELTGEKIQKGRFACGICTSNGTCVTKDRMSEVVIEKGKIVRALRIIKEFVDKVGEGDVIIKGANALDTDGNAAVMIGHPTGGHFGEILRGEKAKGICSIIPVGLEKLIPISVSAASKEAGMTLMDYSMGNPVSLWPITGIVITEIQAIRQLSGADAIPIGSGGIGGAEGGTTLVITGTENKVRKAIEIVEKCKGEEPVQAFRENCVGCYSVTCPKRKEKPANQSTFGFGTA